MIKLLQAFGICSVVFTFCHSISERKLFAQPNKKRRHENYFDLEFQIST